MKLVQTRRAVVTALSLAAVAPQTFAHHGWSSFDESKPIYLEGTVKSVKWQNPHAEMVLDITRNASIPADLPKASIPKQTAPVDASSVLGRATVPMRKDVAWTIELAPIARMEAWKVEPVKAGEKVAVVGYTFKDEKGDAVLRVEYLIRDGKVTPLRSGPA